MRIRPAPSCLLVSAALAVVGGRTRLPVDRAPTIAAVQTAPTQAAPTQASTNVTPTHKATDLTAFLRAGGEDEQAAADPFRPFLAGVQPDRLRDMVRLDLLDDHRRGRWGFLTASACVCVPGQDH